MTSGPLDFARFALPPNAYGYCGTDDHDALAGHAKAGIDDRELRDLCRSFEGAWPYLELIAGSSSLADPLDSRVVEAYWVGGGLLHEVDGRAFVDSLENRFQARTDRREWPWLQAKPANGAVPHHSFHVLEVMPRIGMLRAGQVQAILPAMASCLVRPATVLDRTADGRLTVLASALSMVDGRYVLADPAPETIEASNGELPGAQVAVHWGRSCGSLTVPQAQTLGAALGASIQLANETV